jgi:formate dehydrogenase subunit beta
LAKIERLAGTDRDDIEDITRQGDKVSVKARGKKQDFAIGEALFDHCLACELPTPTEYDILLGEERKPSPETKVSGQDIARLKELTSAERWAKWQDEFSRCIRCYACRNVCPACFCERCFVEETEPPWVMPMPQWPDNLIFQVIRNIHVAGRCTDCGECERVCPVNIPLRSLTREMYDIVGELFKFKSGMDRDAQPLMVHYEQTEAEDFFK